MTEFDYSVRGLPTQLTWNNEHVMNQQFDKLGRLTKRTMPNGVETTMSYDQLSQLQKIKHEKSNNTTISSFNYDYDQAGNIVSVTEATEKSPRGFGSLITPNRVVQMKRMMVGLIVLALMGFVGSCWKSAGSLVEGEADVSLVEGKQATVYYNSGCSCCGRYIEYLKQNGVDVKQKRNRHRVHRKIKRTFGIGQSTQSCHTTLIEDYAVEGHVPVSVIAKLLEEKPEQNVVTIPGMPQHAPGMGAPIGEILEVYSVNQSGQKDGIYAKVHY